MSIDRAAEGIHSPEHARRALLRELHKGIDRERRRAGKPTGPIYTCAEMRNACVSVVALQTRQAPFDDRFRVFVRALTCLLEDGLFGTRPLEEDDADES